MPSIVKDSRNRSPYWYVAFTASNGRRFKRSTKTTDIELAKQIAANWQTTFGTTFGPPISRKPKRQRVLRTRSFGISTSTVGAIGELEVCCDLLKKGYAVYRAVSPACKCDLMAFYNGNPIRIEVTTGYTRACGSVVDQKRHHPDNYDVLAICTETSIVYKPELAAWSA